VRTLVLPLSANEPAQGVLRQLRTGPKTTIDLQRDLPLTHAAKAVYDLRHAYGFEITTRRLSNRVALYTLIAEPSPPLGAAGTPPPAAPSRAPVFGDQAAIFEMRHAKAPRRHGPGIQISRRPRSA
jgi:hypothetical protein